MPLKTSRHVVKRIESRTENTKKEIYAFKAASNSEKTINVKGSVSTLMPLSYKWKRG
jgi:hypothetical protein